MSRQKRRNKDAPYYLPHDDEILIGRMAFEKKLPLLLKGPTGCGKTRFMQYLAWELGRELVTISCHDDLTASDLVGRFLIKGGETVWQDGPLTRAVRDGAICYLDEVVEARKDTTVVIHPLTDDRRILPIDKLGTEIAADDSFMLAVSYNPGYQSVTKEMKPSTRQRFVALEFAYPAPELEAEIVAREGETDLKTAQALVRLGTMTRGLGESGLSEGASTRLLIHCGRLMAGGVESKRACRAAITEALTDDHELMAAITEMVSAIFP